MTDLFARHGADLPGNKSAEYRLPEESTAPPEDEISNKPMHNTDPSHLDNLARRIRPRWRQIAHEVGFESSHCVQFQGSSDPDDWRPASRMLQALSGVEVVEGEWKECLIEALQKLDMSDLAKDVQDIE